MRAVEALAIRFKDIDFSVNTTRIHVRKEYSKTRVSRNIYISDEASKYLTQWLDWRCRKRDYNPTQLPNLDDLVFNVFRVKPHPQTLYVKVNAEFNKALQAAKLDERKEGMKKRKITLHSLRRFVKSVISNQVGQDYSEWFLSHNKSPYYTIKESERREFYATKCMKYLTFLDYSTLEAIGNNIEAKLSEKEKEMQLLRQRDSMNTDAIATLSDQVMKLRVEVQELKGQNQPIRSDADVTNK